jgi:hypothetical protein
VTEFLITPGTQELEDGEEVSRTEEVVDALKESVQGVIQYWYNDGSFDFRPDSEEDYRLMLVILTELDIEFRRH